MVRKALASDLERNTMAEWVKGGKEASVLERKTMAKWVKRR